MMSRKTQWRPVDLKQRSRRNLHGSGHSTGFTLGLVLIAVTIGAGGSFWYLQGGEIDLPISFENTPAESAPQVEDESEICVDPVRAAALKVIEEVKKAQATDPAAAMERARFFFEAAGEPAQFGQHAQFVATKLAQDLPRSDVAEYCQSYLILTRFDAQGVDDELLSAMARFADDFPERAAPLQLYKGIADKLVVQGLASEAVRVLKHGIENAGEHRDVELLQKYLTMTRQTLALMSSTDSPPTLRPKSAQTTPPTSPTELIGKPMEISGRTVSGRNFSWSSVKGDWVIVHFWATWCKGCRRHIPELVPVYEKHSKFGVKFVGVSMDSDRDKLASFVEEHGIDWPQVISTEEANWETPLAEKYGIGAVPAFFLIGRDGNVLETDFSPEGADQLLEHHLSQ